MDKTVGEKFPLWALVLIISFGLAILTYLTSNPEVQPIYHRAFAFLGFGVSVLFINAIANEVINILVTLGVMFSLSDVILGLTILSWGNSLGGMQIDLNEG
jgi:sodium/potassium/calcium exchanger 6